MRGTGLRRATRDARRPRDRPPRGKRHRGRYGHAPCWRAGTAFVAARVKEGECGASGRLLRIGEREGFCDLFGGYTVSYGAQFERRALGRHSFSQIYFSGFRHCVCRDEKNEKSMGRFAHTCRGVHAFTRARVFRASDETRASRERTAEARVFQNVFHSGYASTLRRRTTRRDVNDDEPFTHANVSSHRLDLRPSSASCPTNSAPVTSSVAPYTTETDPLPDRLAYPSSARRPAAFPSATHSRYSA